MIGRGNAKKKRFHIGILSMEYIIKEIKDCELIVISNLLGISHLIYLTYNLNLQDFVKFIGYSSKPEIYFKNASLNFFPSVSESFGLVLSEANIHGIPSILLGLDYISIVNKGTVIVYDDSPESLSRESIKLLHNNNINYRKKLGKMVRENMKIFQNEIPLFFYIFKQINNFIYL
jgi:glycosyltransferase involved in cell wall biosynthesis